MFHRRDAYEKGENFAARLSRFERPLFVLAHYDDEVPSAGLLQRLGDRAHVVWVTNSDGLYGEMEMTPEKASEVRKAEGLRSVAIAGVPAARVHCLDYSEVETYRRMAALYTDRGVLTDVLPYFQNIRDAVREAVFDIEPDVVFTLAWQGGQPEHDLTHFFTRLAVAALHRERGRAVPFFHLPAYEYTVLVALRFHPLYRGGRIRLRLTAGELATKLEMLQAYPSQQELFRTFEKVLRWVGRASFLAGAPRRVEDILAEEELGPVSPDLDYTARPHVHDKLTYMFDHFEGTPVTFARSIRPVVRALLGK